MELADWTKTSGVALKRRDAEVCLLDADGNRVVVTLKKVLLIPSYAQDIFSVKVATTNGVKVFLQKIKTNSGIKAAQNLKYTPTKTVLHNNHWRTF